MIQNPTEKKFPLISLLTGVFIYTISANLLYDTYKTLSIVLVLFSLALIMCSAFKSWYQNVFNLHVPYNVICSLLLIYVIFIILTSFVRNNPHDVVTLVSPVALTGYIPVFILLLNPDSIKLNTVFRFCTASSIITIIYVALNFEEIFFTSHIEMLNLPLEEMMEEQEKGQFPSFWAMPGCFLLMNFQFVKSKYIKIIVLTAILLGMGTALAYGRRGNALLLFAFLLCVVYIYMISKEIKTYKKLIVVVLIVAGIIYIWNSLDNIAFMEVFMERFDHDTRGGVEKELADDFGGHVLDWTFGRGIGGRYYTSAFGQRDQMETAYYRMILHGGVLLLIFYLVAASRAFYLGFFKSNNILSKAMALYIALFIVFLFTSSSPFEFSIKIIIFWLCVIFCYSRTWRMKTNIDMENSMYYNL